ncbi:MAG: hypothetical protein R2700_10650 [Solirubrobacterales bacterium]
MAGAEVGGGGAAGEARGQQGADLGEGEEGGVGFARLGGEILQQPVELQALPLLPERGGGEVVGRGERLRPIAERLGLGEAREGGVDAVDQLGEAAGEGDRAALDVVEREHVLEDARVVLAHRDAEEDPVEPPAPRALGDGNVEGLAMPLVDPPVDVGGVDPLVDAAEIVVVEPEAMADRLEVGEVEELGGGEARGGQVEELGERAEDRVGPAQRAVGEPDAQVGRRGGGGGGRELVVGGREPPGAEDRVDQRREVLDVGAHDDDVARLERRVVGEQVHDRVAQHLDLALAAVAGVDLDAAVVVGEGRAGVGFAGGRRARRRLVGGDL